MKKSWGTSKKDSCDKKKLSVIDIIEFGCFYFNVIVL